MNNDRILPGIGLMLAFCVTAPLIDVASKLAAGTVPVGQITAARFLVQAAIMVPVVMWMGQGFGMSAAVLPLVALRGLMLLLATYSFVSAIAVMPVADALAIAFVEPFIILFLGAALFGDRVGPRRIGASLVGFGGALLVIQPSFVKFGMVAIWPLATAVTFALYMLVTRRLSRNMHPVPMQLHTAILAFGMCVPVLWFGQGSGHPALDPIWPQGLDWVWLAGVGTASAIAHIFVTYALRFAPSATLAPLHYLEIISAVALGYLVFGDFPNLIAWAGIGTIAASGLYITYREQADSRRPEQRPGASAVNLI